MGNGNKDSAEQKGKPENLALGFNLKSGEQESTDNPRKVLRSNGFSNCCAIVLSNPSTGWGALIHVDIDGQKEVRVLRPLVQKAIAGQDIGNLNGAVFGSYHPRQMKEADAVGKMLEMLCKKHVDFRKTAKSWTGSAGNVSIYFRPGTGEVFTFGA